MKKSTIERIGLTDQDLESTTVTAEDRAAMYAVTPLDGRYKDYTKALQKYTSEFEWTKRSVEVTAEYLISLGNELGNYEGTKRKVISRPYTEDEKTGLRSLYKDFSEKDFRIVKKIEDKTKHFPVAVVRWAVWKLKGLIPYMEEATHFARTSADTDTNVYNLILRDFIEREYIPEMVRFQETLIDKAEKWHVPPEEVRKETDFPFPFTVFAAQTHGQYAQYTTIKKVFANFVSMLDQSLEKFIDYDRESQKEVPFHLPGKLTGAIGNDSDMLGAYPDHDWTDFNRRFIENLGLKFYPMCDQDEFNVRNSELFDIMIRINETLIKFCDDFWEYTSRGLFLKTTKEQESGSSVMPQKVNLWETEGGWEYLGDAIKDLRGFHNPMMYRRQGDLRRSIKKKSLGIPFGEFMIAIKRIMNEFGRSEPVYQAIVEEVLSRPDMASSYIQTVLRREGKEDAYDAIKKISMGRKTPKEVYHGEIDELVRGKELSEEVGKEIKEGMEPQNRIGYANVFADSAISEARDTISKLKELYKFD